MTKQTEVPTKSPGAIRQVKELTTLDQPMTFAARLEQLKAINLQNHCDAALAARMDFEDRLTRAVKHRVDQILDAITG
jgi:hypothetical protein